MSKNNNSQPSPKQIGELYLISQGVVSLGTRPGFLDKMMGEIDQRRRIIGDRNIDVESEEYIDLCQKAFDNFRKKFVSQESYAAAITNIGKIFNQAESQAKQLDEINWSAVFTDALILSANVTSAFNQMPVPERTSNQSELVLPGLDQTLPLPPISFVNPLPPVAPQNYSVPENIDLVENENHQVSSSSPLNWFNQNLEVPYGVLSFAAAAFVESPFNVLATSIPQAQAVKVGDKDYKTTVYCGPLTACHLIRDEAKLNNVVLVEFDQKQSIESISARAKSKTTRLIISSHGNKEGELHIAGDYGAQPDDFAVRYFPDAKLDLIHGLGCYIGSDVENNYAQNVLKPNQILFLHAGKDEVSTGIEREVLLSLTIEPNRMFPSPENIQILFKKDKTTTIFAEAKAPSFNRIKEITDKGLSPKEAVTEIYDLIAGSINKQRESLLDKFKDIPEEHRNNIILELERVGYRDYSQVTDPEIKKQFVVDYLSRVVMTAEYLSTPKVGLVTTKLVESGLIDVNYATKDGTSIAFIAASSDQHKSVCEVLARNGADFYKKGMLGHSPIFVAAQNGAIEIVEIILRGGSDKINLSDAEGVTPIYTAAQHGHHQIVKTMIEHGADVNIATEKGLSPLIIASSNGHNEIVDILIKAGAEVKYAEPGGTCSALMAAQEGHLEILKSLTKNGADLNQENNKGDTPLIMATYKYKFSQNPKEKKNYGNVIVYLVENGADPDFKTPYGTAYKYAEDANLSKKIKEARDKYIKSLAPNENEKGLVLSSGDKNEQLIEAITNGESDKVALLLSSGANPNLVSENTGETVLLAVMNLISQSVASRSPIKSYENYLDIAKLLIEKGANINAQDKYGWSPLLMAVHHDCVDLVKTMMRVDNIDFSLKNSLGSTVFDLATEEVSEILETRSKGSAESFSLSSENKDDQLVEAIRRGNPDKVALLLEDGANPNHVSKNTGESVLIAVMDVIAQNSGMSDVEDYEDIAQLLIEKGANINAQNDYGWSPAMVAVHHNRIGLAQTMMSSGKIDFSLKNCLDNTVLDLAKSKEMSDIFLETKSKRDGELFAAIRNKDYKLLSSLLESGYDPNAIEYGFSIMTNAIYNNDLELVSILLQSKKIELYPTDNKPSPLCYAAEIGRADVVKLFLENGVNQNGKNAKGWSPLNTAITFSQNEVALILLAHKNTDKNLRIDSWTPLMMAAAKNNKEIVIGLIAGGADVNLKNGGGQTALDIAQGKNFHDLVDLLKTENKKSQEEKPDKTTNLLSSTSSVKKVKSGMEKEL